MKKILTLILICFIFLANAQSGMLNGTGYAPDISVVDINGNAHNLYSYLNSDKVVVLELMSTTCGHCQQYASGTENSYQAYGPNGLDVAEFIALEVNAATSDNDLANFASTYGVSFPMCNGISPTAINYQLYYTPSYYVVYPDSSYVTFCPAYCQTTSSSSTIENLLNTAIQTWLPPVFGCTDPLATNYDASATNDDGNCDYTSYTIKTIGSTFSPDTIICDVGDSINFILGGYHNAVEVSNSTWLAGSTTSNGGFSFGYGATGQFIPINAQTYYYVCQPHVTSGMKGIIIANALPISGCSDSIAINYDPTVTVDDGSCTYACGDNVFYMNMSRLYSYGWWSTTYTIIDTSGNIITSGTCDSLLSDIDTLCLADGCFSVEISGYSPYGGCEASLWNITNINGDTVAVESDCYTYYLTSPVEYSGFYSVNFSVGNSICTFYGCTDTVAVNYWQSANTDDGSCFYSDCTDSIATNYNPVAVWDDGSCVYASICFNSSPTNAYISELIHDRARVNWDNMNDADCMVDQYRVRYREVGTSTWLSKTMENSGFCVFGLNNTSKLILNLTASTTYEYYMKAWYCGGGVSSWSAIQNFTTLDLCPNVINFAVTSPTTTKASFTWDTIAAYSFTRIKLRVDTVGGVWTTAGGFGVFYPVLSKDKNGLNAGQSYRGQARAWCDPTGGPYKSPAWTSLIYWTQPTSVRLEGGSSITDLVIYPNPSRDIFNITFTSEQIQILKIRILNVIGEELINDKLEQFIGEYTKAIDLTKNAKGIYFLEIETNDGVVNKKLILQ